MHVFNSFIIVLSWKKINIFSYTDRFGHYLGWGMVSSFFKHLGEVVSALLLTLGSVSEIKMAVKQSHRAMTKFLIF